MGEGKRAENKEGKLTSLSLAGFPGCVLEVFDNLDANLLKRLQIAHQ